MGFIFVFFKVDTNYDYCNLRIGQAIFHLSTSFLILYVFIYIFQTVEHHLARQMTQDSNGELEKSTERQIKQKLGDVIEEINDNLTELRYIIYEGAL